MRLIAQYAGQLTLAGLITVLLAGSWMAGQSSRSGGHPDLVLGATFALLIPFAIALIYLQGRSRIEE